MTSKTQFFIFASIPFILSLVAIILLSSTNEKAVVSTKEVVIEPVLPTPATPTPTDIPTNTPTATPTKEPSPTPTQDLSTLPTEIPTLTPTQKPAPVVTATKLNTSATLSPTATLLPTPTPSPTPVRIIYVQSRLQSHSLAVVESYGADIYEHAAAPAWSPDGTKIAFFGEPPEYTPGIWFIDADGQNPRQLFPNLTDPVEMEEDIKDHIKNIAWSPDGTKLTFEVDPPIEEPGVWVIDAEPEGGRQISRFRGQQPTWSPDSQKLVVKACLPDCGLWLVNFLGETEQQITSNSEDSYPVWSRLGYLAFSRPIDNSREIYLLRLPNNPNYLNDDWLVENTPQRLTFLNSTATTPVFSSDGREIYFRTDDRGRSDHWDIRLIKLHRGGGGPGTTVEEPVVEGIGPSDDAGLARPSVR